jgi:hypothetical protein
VTEIKAALIDVDLVHSQRGGHLIQVAQENCMKSLRMKKKV